MMHMEYIHVRMPELQKKSKGQAVARLEELLNGFHPMPPETGRSLMEKSRLIRVKRGEFLIRRGDPCRHFYFIVRGVLRGFIEMEDTEITSWVTLEGEIVSSIHALNDNAVCLDNIQALENSLLVSIPFSEVERMFDTHIEFNIVARKILMRYYLDAEYRALLARLPGADRKYEFFLEHYPHMVNRVPLKVVASFLGLRYETLSRIRSRHAAMQKPVTEVNPA